MKLQYRLVAVLLCGILLLMTGCGKPAKLPEAPTAPVAVHPTDTTEATDAEESEAQDASLVSLRQAMVETPQLFAVAYLGYPESIDPDVQADPFAIMQENAPRLCDDLPFLTGIPRERIVGETGELYCIVPLDESATVAVSTGYWDEENQQYIYDNILYSSDSGDPILLFCNGAGWEPDTQLYISGPSGEVFWYPQTDDTGCAMPLHNESGEALFFDFSSYHEMLTAKHRQLKNAQWVTPTAEMLCGSAWQWEGFLKDGREVSYRLRFQEETLSVIWNDGFDETDHEYLYAPWEMTYEEDFAVLSIDFGEFAGVLRYNLLFSEEFGHLYVAMDAAQEDMPIGGEPLYRILSRPAAPEPVEMVGTWELAWTEVEGDRNEAEPGACTIEIRSAASAGLLMSYASRDFPDNNFQNELLTIDVREMYYGCGNHAWVADLDYVGPWDTTYAITLTADGILIKQNYFLLDGAPTVSYEFFRRVA